MTAREEWCYHSKMRREEIAEHVPCQDEPDLFFPDTSEHDGRANALAAKELCNTACPLPMQVECLTLALQNTVGDEGDIGISAGTDPGERRRLHSRVKALTNETKTSKKDAAHQIAAQYLLSQSQETSAS